MFLGFKYFLNCLNDFKSYKNSSTPWQIKKKLLSLDRLDKRNNFNPIKFLTFNLNIISLFLIYNK